MDASQLAGTYEATTSSRFPKQPRRHTRSTQQHSGTAAAVQHAASAVHVAFVAATVFGVCVQDPQPTTSRRTSNLDPTAAAAVCRNYSRKHSLNSPSKRGAMPDFPLGCLRLLLLCSCTTPKANFSTLWQPCMVQQQPYFNVLFFRQLRTMFPCTCVCAYYVGVPS